MAEPLALCGSRPTPRLQRPSDGHAASALGWRARAALPRRFAHSCLPDGRKGALRIVRSAGRHVSLADDFSRLYDDRGDVPPDARPPHDVRHERGDDRAAGRSDRHRLGLGRRSSHSHRRGVPPLRLCPRLGRPLSCPPRDPPPRRQRVATNRQHDGRQPAARAHRRPHGQFGHHADRSEGHRNGGADRRRRRPLRTDGRPPHPQHPSQEEARPVPLLRGHHTSRHPAAPQLRRGLFRSRQSQGLALRTRRSRGYTPRRQPHRLPPERREVPQDLRRPNAQQRWLPDWRTALQMEHVAAGLLGAACLRVEETQDFRVEWAGGATYEHARRLHV